MTRGTATAPRAGLRIVVRNVARAAGALVVLVGVVHLAVGVAQYEWPSFDALWFEGSGIALLLMGALTVLAGSDRAWGALRALALAGNVAGLAFAVLFGVLSDWREPQGPVLIALFAAGAAGCVAHPGRAGGAGSGARTP